MKKKLKIIISCLLILENIFLFFLGYSYFEYKNYLKTLAQNEGLIAKCEELVSSENLFSVVGKLDRYRPSLYVNSGKILLDYGNEVPNAAGVGFVFDQNYQLTNKSCADGWEPETPEFEFNVKLEE